MSDRDFWSDYDDQRLAEMYDAYADLATKHRGRGSWALASYCRNMQVRLAVELSLREQDVIDSQARQMSFDSLL